MAQVFMVVPTGLGTGLTTTVLGLFHALECQGLKVHFFKPISQPLAGDDQGDRSVSMLASACNEPIATPIDIRDAEHLVSQDKGDELLEELVARFEKSCNGDHDAIIIEGMVPTRNQPYATRINKDIVKALDADVILVAAPGADGPDALQDHIDITARAYGGVNNKNVVGCVLNLLGAPIDRDGHLRADHVLLGDRETQYSIDEATVRSHCTLFNEDFKLFGCIPWRSRLVTPRVSDIAEFLEANIINTGDMDKRRVKSVTICARNVAHTVPDLKPGALIFTPGDRNDIVLAACLATLNGIDLAALVLTGGYQPDEEILKLCGSAMAMGLPILATDDDVWQTAMNFPRFNREVPVDDQERIDRVKNITASYMDAAALVSLCQVNHERRLSPPAFRYQLLERARAAKKTIVLPEGNEPRTIKAASICAMRGIARCVLLGDPEEVQRLSEGLGVELAEGVEVFDPEKIRSHYVERLVELRQHKGMTPIIADEALKDNVVLGTMMLEMDHVDGLVSGAVNTTANTIRPPLQLIKTAPGTNLVSSIFFMCLPSQVLVYGDCAINPDPNAEELADIAIQSADSAQSFGIPPRVAMISYSTMGSGQGRDVEKVVEATRIAKQKRPDLLIDGPLQYDAAIMENVALSKAPDSSVAGRATVFVFPDLNTGNTTYKAVQRSADVISIGPMLQGMRKPVNDLSRGALVEDIVFTIALTAIQAISTEN
ncbi:MAG: phosphate acetyltransferase [Motiliproteus sp.]|nr:phosphate acetyltransferase [Motiliproteus sp.]MCW9054259.1 phosphate acetyltransferase [Motiliproteus sp.]